MAEQPAEALAEADGKALDEASIVAKDTPPKDTPPTQSMTHQPDDITYVKLPQGWEGLSIKLQGNRCFISEVPKACFSSNLKVADGTIRNQVDGVSVGDEVVSLNGETPAKVIERISTAGDAWNACSSMNPPHEVGSKTKFDSPPCAACDFLRRRKALGFDVALQMWLRAVKREIRFTLGVRAGSGAFENESSGPSLNASLAEASEPVKRMGLGSLDEKPVSTIVSLQASAESTDRLEKAMERLQKLAELDDKTRDKKYKQANKSKGGKDKGKGKGKRPSGPYLERTRLTDALVTGEVIEWKRNFGWIKPHTPVEHSKAVTHKGRLYVHKIDLEWWVKALTPGSFCRFHVYSDANSLGAEECTELKETPDDDAPPGFWGKESEWQDESWDGDDRGRSRSPRQ